MRHTIMIVEDDYRNLEFMKAALDDSHYDIIFAENAEKALQLMHKHQVNLFLVNMLLPKMNGIEFAAILRENSQYKQTPIVAISAVNEPNLIASMCAAGSCAYLVKPVGISELRQAVHDCLTF